ncbi:MAG TPA: dual specificity protein phosphatase [Ktedonobacterales bacterium]|nr:dual specificity protein phosphatase [Ktedonobacterales bacterium]
MSTNPGPVGTTPDERTPRPDQAEPASPEAQEAPELSGARLRRRGLARWALTGVLRVLYRAWTRVAARLFPEDSRQEELATQIGVPLPDRLNMSWVTPQLAVGGRIRPEDISRLARIGVTRVVDTRSEHKDDAAALAAVGIQLLYLPTPDTYPLSIADLRRGADWVDQQLTSGERVLIHCEHGVGRSVLLTAAALVVGGMNAHDAVGLIQSKRWQAAPNHRQILRLQEFEREIRGGRR